jgi:hypothetical protein
LGISRAFSSKIIIVGLGDGLNGAVVGRNIGEDLMVLHVGAVYVMPCDLERDCVHAENVSQIHLSSSGCLVLLLEHNGSTTAYCAPSNKRGTACKPGAVGCALG